MLLLDVLIRYPAVALLLFLAVLALRDGGRRRSARFAALLSVSIAALLLSTAPEQLRLPNPFHFGLRLVDAPNVVFVWWFGRSLFEDDFRLRRLEWAAFAAFAFPVMAFRLREMGILSDVPVALDVLVNAVSTAMMAHLAWTAWHGRRDDVIESRRRVRVWFAIALAIAAVFVLQAENLLYPDYDAQLSTMRAAVVLIMVGWGYFWLMRFHPEHLTFEPAPVAITTAPSVDPRDKALHTRLLHLIEEENVYTEQGLTLHDLAERLGVPDHQLRALINKGMGHRNFSAFINGYRIEAAKRILRDPDKSRVQILTIAMDTGFGSLAPFNRAFRAAEGVTPTEFRNAALMDEAQDG